MHCFGRTGGPGIVESGNGLADRMDTSESSRTIGPLYQPHDYLTSFSFTACERIHTHMSACDVAIPLIDNRCYLSITVPPNDPHTRTASWHESWEAAILVNAKWIRAGREGLFAVISAGMSGTILGFESSLMIGLESEHRWLGIQMGDLQESNNLTLPLAIV